MWICVALHHGMFLSQAYHDVRDVPSMGLKLDTGGVLSCQGSVAGDHERHEDREENEFSVHGCVFLAPPKRLGYGRGGYGFLFRFP